MTRSSFGRAPHRAFLSDGAVPFAARAAVLAPVGGAARWGQGSSSTYPGNDCVTSIIFVRLQVRTPKPAVDTEYMFVYTAKERKIERERCLIEMQVQMETTGHN